MARRSRCCFSRRPPTLSGPRGPMRATVSTPSSVLLLTPRLTLLLVPDLRSHLARIIQPLSCFIFCFSSSCPFAVVGTIDYRLCFALSDDQPPPLNKSGRGTLPNSPISHHLCELETGRLFVRASRSKKSIEAPRWLCFIPAFDFGWPYTEKPETLSGFACLVLPPLPGHRIRIGRSSADSDFPLSFLMARFCSRMQRRR